MTISPFSRVEAMDLALIYMLDRIGDESVNLFHVDPNDAAIADLPDTTWTELVEAQLVQRRKVMGPAKYEFTHYGWVEALKRSGKLPDDPELLARCQKLVQTLKGYVKGRGEHFDALVSHHELARDTGLPIGWLFNVVKSGLLAEMFPTKKMNVRLDGSSTFRVPQTFGMDILR